MNSSSTTFQSASSNGNLAEGSSQCPKSLSRKRLLLENFLVGLEIGTTTFMAFLLHRKVVSTLVLEPSWPRTSHLHRVIYCALDVQQRRTFQGALFSPYLRCGG